MIEIEADGFKFEFSDAIEAYVFDEKDPAKPKYHGAPMKGVDIVAEFIDAYVYIEIKDYDDPSIFDIPTATSEEEKKEKQGHFRWLKNYLKYKYRDSYLYRYAEHKVEKPIHYICLITFDNALNNRLQKALKPELPIGKAGRRWMQNIAQSCQVVNIDRWNHNFPKWKVTYIGE